MDKFIAMASSGNSYVRTRGLALIAHNAKWDVDDKIDGIIGGYLEHITDEKPICARPVSYTHLPHHDAHPTQRARR